ncbi:MAG: ROK family protein [Bacteroidales bacterium]
MNIFTDKRIVITLDAGGTNFVFSAIRAGEELIDPIGLPSDADNLRKCLGNISEGFRAVKSALKEKPAAISFAFPGPADYPAGIIGDLNNLPAFRGGIALGPMLQEQFGIPVFINNDGDLFAYGEAIAGFLPALNKRLSDAGSTRRYRNLLGVTLGTGFGAGIVRNDELFLGDNSAGAEIWLMRHRDHSTFVEEGVGIRAIQREYTRQTNPGSSNPPSPKEIYEIATGSRPGNSQAARQAFLMMAQVVGDALANAITLIDGLVVIGGGLTGASSLFLPLLVEEMNRPFNSLSGNSVNRLESKAFNLENEKEFKIFATGEENLIPVPGSSKSIPYDPIKRVGVGISSLGTSKAVSLGAYAFAVRQLDRI